MAGCRQTLKTPEDVEILAVREVVYGRRLRPADMAPTDDAPMTPDANGHLSLFILARVVLQVSHPSALFEFADTFNLNVAGMKIGTGYLHSIIELCRNTGLVGVKDGTHSFDGIMPHVPPVEDVDGPTMVQRTCANGMPVENAAILNFETPDHAPSGLVDPIAEITPEALGVLMTAFSWDCEGQASGDPPLRKLRPKKGVAEPPTTRRGPDRY